MEFKTKFKTRANNAIAKFLSSSKGKRFFQVFYSLGASIIILGVLSEIMHWSGGWGHVLLYIGFFTEALVFAISAFDKPAEDWEWDRVFPVLDNEEVDAPVFAGSFSGGYSGDGANHALASVVDEKDRQALTESIHQMTVAADDFVKLTKEMGQFNVVTDTLADVSNGISESSRNYVTHMGNLNQNIEGLNAVYEMQLKSVGTQIDAIKNINEGLVRIKDLYQGSLQDSSIFQKETEIMAKQLKELNAVYARLLSAMTSGGAPIHNS
ncbi:MAG: gliding motility protein GldL [Candidatus Symbiothrix sp.]|jgi:gliding motility-associated protein GldL|nr:gliding motility protein GldL [Candidatus Symbiothrix sp.]